jgi:hypothetical protein
MYPFNLHSDDYILAGIASKFYSTRYDGIDELSDEFVEPELVYYKTTNSIGIQGHPEWCDKDDKYSKVCAKLIGNLVEESTKIGKFTAISHEITF